MKTIHHVVDIDAAGDTVWAALTDPTGLAGWWCTEVSSPTAEVGADIHWTFGGDANPVMRITTLRPGELVWRCVAGLEPWQDSTFRFSLEPLGDGRTRLRFWHEYAVPPADDAYGDCNYHWAYYLESLRQYCSTGAGMPYRPEAKITPEFRITNLDAESTDYTAARDRLQEAEITLMRHRERVAGLRRRLPAGPVVEDYAFLEGPTELAAGDSPVREIRLSELFTGDDRSLVIYHLMYGKQKTTPCPMCTMWIDGLNGVVRHLARNVDFAVVAAAEPAALRAYARDRGWSNVRLLSAGKNTFKYDLNSEDTDGVQDSTVSVFTRDSDGAIRHHYTTHPRMSPELDQRGIDLLNPVWHVLDLTPQGRGEWYAGLDY